MIETLNKHAPKELSWSVPDGGLNLWISCPRWFRTDTFLVEAQKIGVLFLPSSACYPREAEQHHMRICFSYMNEKKLEEGIIKLCNLLTEALKTEQHTFQIV